MEFLLTTGQICLIDEIDKDLLEFEWYASHKRKNSTYARRGVNGKIVKIHEIVADRKGLIRLPGFVIDHANRNSLDNRRDNIRIVTVSGNNANREHKPNAMKYRGVYKNYDKFVAQITINNKVKHLGRFNTKEEAAHAYNIAAQATYGECAMLNVII